MRTVSKGVSSLLLLVLALAAPAHADLRYTGWGVTLHSSTAGQPQDLPATLWKPDGDGPFPAVVMLHDCSGLGAHSSGAPGRWANLLAAKGYVVIMPDSYGPRGYPDGICTARGDQRLPTTAAFPRAADAYAAIAYLRALAYVDGQHVGVMGGSAGGAATLAAMVEPGGRDAMLAEEKRAGFAAGVALYPACAVRYGAWAEHRAFRDRGPVTEADGVYRPIAPLLILVGEKDDWTPAAPCQALAARAQALGLPVSIKVYPDAHHSFDSANPMRYVPGRVNFSSPSGMGATTGGNPAAWADAIEQVQAFFAQHLREQR